MAAKADRADSQTDLSLLQARILLEAQSEGCEGNEEDEVDEIVIEFMQQESLRFQRKVLGDDDSLPPVSEQRQRRLFEGRYQDGRQDSSSSDDSDSDFERANQVLGDIRVKREEDEED